MAAAAGATLGAGATTTGVKTAALRPADLKALSAFEGVVTTIAGAAGKRGTDNSSDGSKATFYGPRGIALCCVSAGGKNSRLLVADSAGGSGVRGVGVEPPHAVWTAATQSGIACSIAAAGTTGGIAVGTSRGIAFGEASVSSGAPATRLQVLAGHADMKGFADGDALTAARFFNVMGVCVSADGQRMYAADSENNRVRLLDRQEGTVTTVAGTGERKNGPDGPALTTAMLAPYAVAFDPLTPKPETALFVGCSKDLRRIDLTTGQLATLYRSERHFVYSLAAAPCGLLLVGTSTAVFAVDPRAGPNSQPVLLAGDDGKLGSSVDGAARSTARMGAVGGLALDDTCCCVWFTDLNANTIRKLTLPPGVFVAPPKPAPAPADDRNAPEPGAAMPRTVNTAAAAGTFAASDVLTAAVAPGVKTQPPAPVAAAVAAGVGSVGTGDGADGGVTYRVVPNDSDEWEAVENAWALNEQKANDDYVAARIRAGLRPVTFRLTAVERIENPTLQQRFDTKIAALKAAGRNAEELRVRWGFHGTKAVNLKRIGANGLLRVGHPLNPSKSTDPGYFGAPTAGVYVSRYYDYVLKYANGLEPLQPGESVRILMFRVVPGKCFHVTKQHMGMSPTPGYDAHHSPNFLEWYLFDESACVPYALLTVKAIENRRTDADDIKLNAGPQPPHSAALQPALQPAAAPQPAAPQPATAGAAAAAAGAGSSAAAAAGAGSTGSAAGSGAGSGGATAFCGECGAKRAFAATKFCGACGTKF